MKYIISFVLLVFTLVSTSWASDPSFKTGEILDESGKIKQTIKFLSDADLQTIIPEHLKRVLALPRAESTLLKPHEMFTYDARGLNQNFYPVNTNQYALMTLDKHKEAEFSYLLTSGLCECVGISIYIPTFGCGLMHAGFESLPKLVTQFLGLFPKQSRAQAKVVLVSGYLSVVLAEVHQLLGEEGYKNISVDIIPTYLDSFNRTSSGMKYISYEKLGLSKEDAIKMSALHVKDIEKLMNTHITRCPEIGDCERVLVTNFRDGRNHQFFERGCGGASSQIVNTMYMTRRFVEGHNVPPALHKSFMTTAIDKMYNEVLTLQELLCRTKKLNEQKEVK